MSNRPQIVYRFHEFELRSGERLLLRRGRPVAVEPKVLDLIHHLVRNAGRVVAKRELLESLWPNLAVVDGVVHRCVSRARLLFGDSRRDPGFIVTRGRAGYQFTAEVAVLHSALPGDTSLPSPPSGDDAGSPGRTPLVGRSREAEILQRVLDDLRRQGRGTVLSVVGGPGMGKTVLFDLLAAEASRSGARVLRSPCREVDGAPPFGPWIRILLDLATGHDGAALLAALGSAGADLAGLLPQVPGLLSAPPPAPLPAPASSPALDQQRHRFFASAEHLLQLAAAATPTVILVDDLHCGDESSLAFWRYLTPLCARTRLLLACSYREGEVRRRKVLQAIDAEGFTDDRAVRIDLLGLSPSETEILVAPILGPATARRVADRVQKRSEGNPFFSLELARHLRRLESEDGGIEIDRILDDQSPILSAGIRAVLSLRQEALTSSTRQVLACAATIGRDFDLSRLRAASTQSAEEVDAAIDEAVAADLLESKVAIPGAYRFRHVLLRDVFYEDSAPSMRRSFHRRIASDLLTSAADVLEDRLPEIAHHLLQAATDGGADEAAAFAIRAAEQATRRLAFEDAARAYEGALAALRLTGAASERRRCEVQLEMADCWDRSGDDKRAATAYRDAVVLARHLHDASLLARAAIGVAVRFGQPVDFGVPAADATELLEEALQGLPPAPSAERALVLACLAFARYAAADYATANNHALRSEEDALGSGDERATCVALVARHLVSLEPGNAARAGGIADRLIDAALASSREDMALVGHTYRVFRLLEEGSDGHDLDRAVALRATVASRLRQPQGDWWSNVLGATVAMMRGDWRRCDELSRRAREIALRSMNANQDLAFRTQQAQVLIHRGDVAAMLKLSRESCERYPHLQATYAAHCALLAAVGERDESLRFARSWHGRDLSVSLQASNWLLEAACLAQLAFLVEDERLARSVHAFLEPHRGRNVIVGQGIGYNGPVARLLALTAWVLGEHDAALRDFAAALESARAFRAAPWVVRTQLDLVFCRRRLGKEGDETRCANLLAEAGASARRLGATGFLMEIALLQSGSH